MSRKVTVVDYGVGNLLSVCRALEHCGAEVSLTSEPATVSAAERLLLPGVGAFADGMRGLAQRGLLDAVKRYAARGRPFLGICLGMQMMLDGSDEFGAHEGLGLFSGRVIAVPDRGVDGAPHKIPHIGWNALLPSGDNADWNGTLLAGLTPGASVYFVHSYHASLAQPRERLAHALYDGQPVTAVIGRDLLYGCQFHPEKSGPVGLRILDNFLAL